MPRWPSSLRSRLTLWYSILLAAPLIAFAYFGYATFERTLLSRTDRFVRDALSAFSRELVAERRATSDLVQAIRTTVDELRFRELQIVILDRSHNVVAAPRPTGDAESAPREPNPETNEIVAALRQYDAPGGISTTLSRNGREYRLISHPLTIGDQPLTLTATYSLRENAAMLERIRRVFLVAIPLLIACAATGGYFLAKRSLEPVSSMTARAAEISATNLHERLPVGGGVELVGLAKVVNDLLDRLERSFGQQRRFMADASHELRTPTAIVRTEAEVALARHHRSEDEYRASVTIMLDAARHLTRIVDDLFLLARTDSGQPVARREEIYLDEVVHDATRNVRHVAERRGVSVELRDAIDAPFRGDADLLGRLLLNLLDNAIKHSPAGATVEVAMAPRNGCYEVCVIDAGTGIPSDAQERVFERFFRVSAERPSVDGSSSSGAGLGLAIARRIAEIHDGRLDLVESRPGRTEFRLTLPAADPVTGQTSSPSPRAASARQSDTA